MSSRRSSSRLAILLSLLSACGGTGTPANPDAGTAGFTFQPSNVNLSDIVANKSAAAPESVTMDCSIAMDHRAPAATASRAPSRRSISSTEAPST